MTIEKLRGKRIGINIMGGAMKSTAYAGMLKAFAELDLDIHALIGSSGGAVVSASYAFGNTPEQILAHFEAFRPLQLFNPINMIRQRGIDYTAWEEHAAELVPMDKQIEDASIKLAVRTVDLATKDSVYLTTGSAVKAVIASSAILGGYEYNGHKYIDGDYDPETGVQELRKLGAEITLLAMVVSEPGQSLFNLDVTQQNALNSEIALHRPDGVVRLPVAHNSFFARGQVRQHFNDGYQGTQKFLKTGI